MSDKQRDCLMVSLVVVVLIFLLWACLAVGGGSVRIQKFDKDYNRTGYSVIDNGRESNFDREGNRTGTSIRNEGGGRIDHFDSEWNRQGHSDIEDDNPKDDKDGKENN